MVKQANIKTESVNRKRIRDPTKYIVTKEEFSVGQFRKSN